VICECVVQTSGLQPSTPLERNRAAVGSDMDGQVNAPMNVITYGRADEDPTSLFVAIDAFLSRL
jgi:hypothetical protein